MWELYVPFLVLTITIITHSAGETVKIYQHQPSSNCGASYQTPEQLSSKRLSQIQKNVTGTVNRHSPEDKETSGGILGQDKGTR